MESFGGKEESLNLIPLQRANSPIIAASLCTTIVEAFQVSTSERDIKNETPVSFRVRYLLKHAGDELSSRIMSEEQQNAQTAVFCLPFP